MFGNCFEVTFELSCCKYPKAHELAREWSNNQEALIAYMEQVHMGVKGNCVYCSNCISYKLYLKHFPITVSTICTKLFIVYHMSVYILRMFSNLFRPLKRLVIVCLRRGA